MSTKHSAFSTGRIVRRLFFLLLAVLAAWLGIQIPSHFRSVSPLVLENAGEGSIQAAGLAERYLDSANIGVAELLLQINEDETSQSDLQERAERLIEENPLYQWSGGGAPFYEQFLSVAPVKSEDQSSVLTTILPAENREKLLGFLEESASQNVHTILETRNLSGYQLFLPVFSSGGQPLDSTILTTALLIQSSTFQGDLQDSILNDAKAALDGNNSEALQSLEIHYASILTLARRTNWTQLQAVVKPLESSNHLHLLARLTQENENNLSQVFAATAMADEPAEVFDYIRRYQEDAWAGIGIAVREGQGAVRHLLTLDKPIYEPTLFWKQLVDKLPNISDRFLDLARSMPQGSLFLRALCFIFFGYWLTCFIYTRYVSGKTQKRLLELDRLVIGVIVAIFVFVTIEPNLLNFQPNEEGTLTIDLAGTSPQSPQTESQDSTMFDQVTILVLIMFLVVQLMIFIFGLLKINEIRRHPGNPDLKLKLLDNEENLFELGLYVGLGGTVASLILVVLNIVDASLMTAYASTLFGIIFVALLKVMFLRPYRRELIIRDSDNQGG